VSLKSAEQAIGRLAEDLTKQFPRSKPEIFRAEDRTGNVLAISIGVDFDCEIASGHKENYCIVGYCPDVDKYVLFSAEAGLGIYPSGKLIWHNGCPTIKFICQMGFKPWC